MKLAEKTQRNYSDSKMKEAAHYSVVSGPDQRSSQNERRNESENKSDHYNAISISISQKDQADE